MVSTIQLVHWDDRKNLIVTLVSMSKHNDEVVIQPLLVPLKTPCHSYFKGPSWWMISRFTIPYYTARYGWYVLVRQLIGTQIARYRAIPNFLPHIGQYRAVPSSNDRNFNRYPPVSGNTDRFQSLSTCNEQYQSISTVTDLYRVVTVKTDRYRFISVFKQSIWLLEAS